MTNLNLVDMAAMQKRLQAKYDGIWDPLVPNTGRNKLLWMIEEIGEAIAIIKKQGEKAIMEDPEVREAFVEELADVAMYYQDLLLCFDVSPDEFSHAYVRKHQHNMERDFVGEHRVHKKT